MVKITLVSLLHTLGARFPVYPVSLLLPLLEQHQGDVWLPACKERMSPPCVSMARGSRPDPGPADGGLV